MNAKVMRRIFAGALAVAAMESIAVTTETWIGGDQSSVDSSMEQSANWDGGQAIVNGLANTYEFVIDQDGASATMKHGSTGYSISGALTIGSDSNPNVKVEFTSTRNLTINGVKTPDNSSPAVLRIGGIFKALGANTVIKINRGFALCTRNNNDNKTVFAQISPEVTFEGEGIINFGDGSRLVPGNDYDDLWVQIGQENGSVANYTLNGDLTSKRLEIFQGGTGGIGGLSELDIAGYTVDVRELAFGTLDNRTGDANPGNQSSFGAIVFNGGTVKVAGDFEFRGDVDGSSTYNGTYTPFVRDHYLTTGQNGGRLEIGGSMAIRSRSNTDWFLNDLTVTFNGDGSTVQEFEALQTDEGDTRDCLNDGYAYGTIEVASGASVKLVDAFDNDRTVEGAEAVYARNLKVAAGATLDLNGINLYVFKTPTIEGTVVNGTVTKLVNAGIFETLEYVLGTPGTASTGTRGNWVGPMAAGDFDGDGKPELAVVQMDEDTACEDSKVYVLKYDGSAMAPIYDPVLDTKLFQSTPSQMRYADLGDGKGSRLIYTSSSYSDVRAYDPVNATYETLVASASYGNANFILSDLDGDGVNEIVGAYRDGRTANLKVYSVKNGEMLWTKLLSSDATVLSRVGVADVDGDRKNEVLALTKTGTDASAYKLYVFKTDGTQDRELTLDFVRGEATGLITARDVTGDGKNEIVIVETDCNNNYNTPAANNKGGLFVVNAETGATLFSVYASEADWSVSHTAAQFFDADDDGICEILYGDKIYKGSVVDGAASFAVYAALPLPTGRHFCYTLTPALVDMTGDGVPEIIYGCDVAGLSDNRTARQISAYDPVEKVVLDGFPQMLVSTQEGSDSDQWRAGGCQHWYTPTIIAADFDGDNKWELAVGLGTPNAGKTTRASLNIIKTPYSVTIPAGRTEAQVGTWSYGRDEGMTFAYPMKKKSGFTVIIR